VEDCEPVSGASRAILIGGAAAAIEGAKAPIAASAKNELERRNRIPERRDIAIPKGSI
jgi:hypothetical protein